MSDLTTVPVRPNIPESNASYTKRFDAVEKFARNVAALQHLLDTTTGTNTYARSLRKFIGAHIVAAGGIVAGAAAPAPATPPVGAVSVGAVMAALGEVTPVHATELDAVIANAVEDAPAVATKAETKLAAREAKAAKPKAAAKPAARIVGTAKPKATVRTPEQRKAHNAALKRAQRAKAAAAATEG